MMAFAFWRGAIQRAFGLSRCGPDLRGWGASMGFGATGAAGSEATLPTGLLWEDQRRQGGQQMVRGVDFDVFTGE